MKRTASILVGLALACALPVAAAVSDPSADSKAAIALVNKGDFEAAISALDAVAPRLALAERARAFAYEGAAYVGLAREPEACESFKKALAADRKLRLDADTFSPRRRARRHGEYV